MKSSPTRRRDHESVWHGRKLNEEGRNVQHAHAREHRQDRPLLSASSAMSGGAVSLGLPADNGMPRSSSSVLSSAFSSMQLPPVSFGFLQVPYYARFVFIA